MPGSMGVFAFMLFTGGGGVVDGLVFSRLGGGGIRAKGVRLSDAAAGVRLGAAAAGAPDPEEQFMLMTVLQWRGAVAPPAHT